MIPLVFNSDTVAFMWIKLHCNIFSANERVDQLAKDAGENGVQDRSYKLAHYNLPTILKMKLSEECTWI